LDLVDKLASKNQRTRTPDRKQSEPKLLTHSIDLQHDAHNILHNEYRPGWRQVNTNPELLWSQRIYPTKVDPNLRGSVYLEHLTPITPNKKCLSWLHSAMKKLDIKMLSHRNIWGEG
jgi:hypothetical protein